MLRAQEIDGLLTIRASGKLSGRDCDAFIPLFERVAARAVGTVPMLIELTPDFVGWDITGLWRDLKFDVRHKDQFGRIAIVGDRKWEDWGTTLLDPFFRADMRFFPRELIGEAETWVRRGEADRPS